MKTWFFPIAVVCAIATAVAAQSVSFFGALRAADTRLAVISERLTTANVALCDRRVSALGLVIHGINQYQKQAWPAVRQAFGFAAPVAVEAVIAGGAADRAGVRPNDGLLSVDGVTLPASADAGGPLTTDRDRALAAIETATPGRPIVFTLLRGGLPIRIAITGPPACRSRFEIVVGRGLDALADGLHVQLGEKYFEGFSDEDIAVVAAHELAHNILRHRERLDAARVSRGLLGEFGRNARIMRTTEDQADALGVYLLANAGYDPYAAGRFWRSHGEQIGVEGIFRSQTHSSAKARAVAVDAIADTLRMRGARPILPDILAERDKPLE